MPSKRSAAPTEPTDAPAARPASVQLRARRSPRLILLGILAVALGGLGAAALYSSSTTTESAVVMARDVVRGQEITSADLAIVSVPAGLQVEATDADRMSSLIGQRALTDLPAGAFPAERHLGTEPVPTGQTLVGLKLSQGRLPMAALPPGSKVQLVSLAEGATGATDAVVATAPVASDDGSGYALDVTVAAGSAHIVATLAANDQLALVAVGGA